MAQAASVYVCQSCAATSNKWLGRCPECGQWNTMVEEAPAAHKPSGRAATLVSLGAASTADDDQPRRIASGLDLVDRVLGGGVVPGATVLLAGEPGIGKSTLLLQVADRSRAGSVVYVSAEESLQQLRLRARRLGVEREELGLVGETDLDLVVGALESARPALALVDSVQALRAPGLASPPGSIGQVRAVADRLVDFARRSGTALFLVGHVTKDGAIAGPKSLEHLVDAVITFEGEHESQLRILRASKNRFGPTGEVALFEMRDSGLHGVQDPSRVLLARRRGSSPGSIVTATIQGTRPLLVEVQALTTASQLPTPRRMAVGVDGSRLVLLLAVLERFAGVALSGHDIFANVVGGLSLKDPAGDLAIAAALLSAASGKPAPRDAIFVGEVGLLGELRPVSRTEARLREAAQLGFQRAFVAADPAKTLPSADLEVTPLESVDELLRLFPPRRPSSEREEPGADGRW